MKAMKKISHSDSKGHLWQGIKDGFHVCKGGLLEHVAFELCPEWWRKVVVSGQVSRRARKNMLQRALSTCLCTPCLYNGDPGVCAIVDYFHIENLTDSFFSFPIPSFLLALFLSPFHILFLFLPIFSVLSFLSPPRVCECVYIFFAFLKGQN